MEAMMTMVKLDVAALESACNEEQRYANGALDRLSSLAAELVRHKVDAIVVGGTHDAKAAKMATTAIPVVFTLVGDPAGSKLVASLARPGGNVTGLSNQQRELILKGAKPADLPVEQPTRFDLAIHSDHSALNDHETSLIP